MYLSTLTAARTAGRRTLAQLSGFDTIITIAIGSILASTSVSPDPSYAQGITALLTLLALQLGLGVLRRRMSFVGRLVDFAPEVVVRNGAFQPEKHVFGPQLTPGELESALRQHGVFDPGKALVVVLEPTGKFSVALDAQASEAKLIP